jgi:hypothetical protein
MVAKTLLAIGLMCPHTAHVNKTDEPWNDYDKKIFLQVQKRCGQIYPDAPCVKLFRKFDTQSYTVLCGKGEDSNVGLDLP